MFRYLFALICAAMVFLGTSTALAGNDTYTCDAYAEYHSDASGTRAVVRKTWTNVTYKIAPLSKENNDVNVLVFFSGDGDLDTRYRNTAPAFKGTATQKFVLDWMAKQPYNTVVTMARDKSAKVSPLRQQNGPLHAQSVCWRNGDTPPDRSAWPGQTTCKGAIYFHVRAGEDYPFYEHVIERSGLSGPVTAAESTLRGLLLAFARLKAAADAGDQEKFVLDTHGGSLEATPIKCWQGVKPSAPSDWRGPTSW